jgi:DNA-binding NarL/FixJ family response regulator
VIRVVVGEDDLLVREGIARLLGTEDGIEIVESCHDEPSVLSAVDELQPDVVLTDIRMPPTQSDEGIRIAAALRDGHPQIGVVVLSQYSDPRYVLSLFDHGSARRAYLFKERLGHRFQLVEAIREVARGGSVVDPKVVEVLIDAPRRAAESPLARLTPRELEVLGQIAQGKSNRAIGESLVLTKRAVEKHVNSIFAKLRLPDDEDVSRRVYATLMFLAERHDA